MAQPTNPKDSYSNNGRPIMPPYEKLISPSVYMRPAQRMLTMASALFSALNLGSSLGPRATKGPSLMGGRHHTISAREWARKKARRKMAKESRRRNRQTG